jgi:hypothetical protein
VWKIHRKSLNYSFNLKILQTFIPIFIENAQKLCDELSVNVEKKKQFDMLAYTSKSALNMICGWLSIIILYATNLNLLLNLFFHFLGTSFGLDIKNAVLTDDVFHALEK